MRGDDPIRRRCRPSYIDDRPPLAFDGDRPPLAVCVVINAESFDNHRVAGPAMAGTPGQPPDIANATWREYGNRVGIWRLFAILAELGIPATVAQNSANATEHPAICQYATARGWEVIGHGELNNQPVRDADPAREAATIARALDALTEACGVRPRGWLSPGLMESDHTVDLLSAAGLRYVADWVLDEQPVLIEAEPRPLVAFPYTLELNDFPAVLRFGLSGADFAERIHDQYEQLRHEASRSSRVMTIALHPFITGVPHRARHLRQVLSRIAEDPAVWFATAAAVVDSCASWLGHDGHGDE